MSALISTDSGIVIPKARAAVKLISKLELPGLFDREITGPSALDDHVREISRSPRYIENIWCIGHEAPIFHEASHSPVKFPPGRARLAANPARTGSAIPVTTGFSMGRAGGDPRAKEWRGIRRGFQYRGSAKPNFGIESRALRESERTRLLRVPAP